MKMPPCDHDECGVTACKQMKIDPHDQAFPCLESPEYRPIAGLTKREYFAAFMMQALLTNPNTGDALTEEESNSPLRCAELAVEAADALITALNK